MFSRKPVIAALNFYHPVRPHTLGFFVYLQFFLYLQRGVASMTSAHCQWLSRLPLCWAHVVELTISALSQSSYGLFVTEGRTLLWLTSCFCLTTFTWNLFPWIHQCIPVTAIVKEAKLDAVIWTLLQASWRMMCSIIKLNLHIKNLLLMLPQWNQSICNSA